MLNEIKAVLLFPIQPASLVTRQSHWGYDWWSTTCDLKILRGLRWSLKGRWPSYDGLVDLWTGFRWPVNDRGYLYDHFNDFGPGEVFNWCMHQIPLHNQLVFYQSATGRRWFSVVCDQSLMVRDFRMMVFSILAQTLGVRLVRDQSPISRQPVAHRWATIRTNWRDCKDLS